MKTILIFSIFAVFSVQGMLPQQKLYEGVTQNNIDLMIETKYEGADVNFEYPLQIRNLLIIALYHENKEAALWLIHNGINVNAVIKDGDTGLMLTPTYLIDNLEDVLEVSQELIKYGANINTQNEHGDHSLFFAVSSAVLPLVKLLVEKGANIDLKNFDHITALQLAKAEHFDEIAEYLEKIRTENIEKRKEKIKEEANKHISTGKLGPVQHILEYAEEYVFEIEENKKEKEEFIKI